VAYFAPHRARALAILTTGAGEAGNTIAAGLYRLPPSPLDVCGADAVERAVEVEIAASAPIEANTLNGRDLRASALVVRVGYRYEPEGSLDAGVDAAALGGADAGSVEDRASEDAALILAAVGHQPSWDGLDPVVIDCAPDARGWSVAFAGDRATLTVPFDIITRAVFPGTHGPAST